MADLRVASRYVKSLLDLAVEQNVLEEVHTDMQLFSATCRANRNFTVMLKSPVIRHEKKRAILEKLFKGKVNKLSLAIMDILTFKNRESLLPLIATEFHHAYNIYRNIGKASVTTTLPMDNSLREQILVIARKLSERKEVELEEKVDETLV